MLYKFILSFILTLSFTYGQKSPQKLITLRLVWSQHIDESSYVLTVYKDKNFQRPLRKYKTQTSHLDLINIPQGRYGYTIDSYDKWGRHLRTSTQDIFSINHTHHQVNYILSREDIAIVAKKEEIFNSVKLQWNSRDSQKYYIQLFQSFSEQRPVYARIVEGEEITLLHLPPGPYYWRLFTIKNSRLFGSDQLSAMIVKKAKNQTIHLDNDNVEISL